MPMFKTEMSSNITSINLAKSMCKHPNDVATKAINQNIQFGILNIPEVQYHLLIGLVTQTIDYTREDHKLIMDGMGKRDCIVNTTREEQEKILDLIWGIANSSYTWQNFPIKTMKIIEKFLPFYGKKPLEGCLEAYKEQQETAALLRICRH